MNPHIEDPSHDEGAGSRDGTGTGTPRGQEVAHGPDGDPQVTDTAVAEGKPGAGRTIRLEAPGTGVKDTWKAMGPGVAAAMTGIGASHIMHGPTAGAEYAYALLWVIPFAYIIKYCAFEFAHRYTIVKGESVMAAYERTGEGRGHWPMWYLAFQSLANTFGIAGRALGCAALLYAAFPFMPLTLWATLILVTCVAILWLGKYSAVEGVVKAAIIVFAVAVLVAFVLRMPPPTEYVGNLLPALAPAGAILLFGAMWGYFPTTLEVAPMQSNWAVDKKAGMAKVRALENEGYNVELAPNYLRNNFKLFKRDMNISYVISALTGIAFLIVGAVMLHPIGLVPEGSEMGTTIARMYTDTFGAWIFPVIIAGGVSALFSTVFTYFDGQARIFEECCVRIRKVWDTPKIRKVLYRGFQILWLVSGTAIVYGMPEPIVVVQVASVLALLFGPVIFWLNIKAIRDNFKTPEEREFLPSKAMFTWAWLGVLGLAVISVYFLYIQFATGEVVD